MPPKPDPVASFPRSFSIANLDWKVEVEPTLVDDFGECDGDSRTIKIGNLGIQALNQKRLEIPITLIHELIHAVRQTYGLDRGTTDVEEEKQVRFLEAIISSLILSNPKQMRVILDMMDTFK